MLVLPSECAGATAAMNTQVLVNEVPEAAMTKEHFAVKQVPAPTEADVKDGEALCEVLAIYMGAGIRISLAPHAKDWAGDGVLTARPPKAGGVMTGPPGHAVARVRHSKDPKFPVGALVTCSSGWQRFSVQRARALTLCEEGTGPLADPAHHIGVFGINGLTAYFGLFEAGKPQAGETVVVSAAASSVGHIVCQLAKSVGCRVVGIAGSDHKCDRLTKELGVDATVNYKHADFPDKLKAACPDGIGTYFDNTGGDVLQSVLLNMKTGGRIAICGVVSQYDDPMTHPSPIHSGMLLNKALTIQGFILFDYASKFEQARAHMKELILAGKLTAWQDEVQGLDKAPAAFVEQSLSSGGTHCGTTIVRV